MQINRVLAPSDCPHCGHFIETAKDRKIHNFFMHQEKGVLFEKRSISIERFAGLISYKITYLTIKIFTTLLIQKILLWIYWTLSKNLFLLVTRFRKNAFFPYKIFNLLLQKICLNLLIPSFALSMFMNFNFLIKTFMLAWNRT